MLPELFQVSVMQMKQDYGLTWMWMLLLQFTADVTQMYDKLLVN